MFSILFLCFYHFLSSVSFRFNFLLWLFKVKDNWFSHILFSNKHLRVYNFYFRLNVYELCIIIMKYIRQINYEEKRFILDHGSGGPSPRLSSPFALGLWQGQQILAGAFGRANCLYHKKQWEIEKVHMPNKYTKKCSHP